jgi:hypothetical protein
MLNEETPSTNAKDFRTRFARTREVERLHHGANTIFDQQISLLMSEKEKQWILFDRSRLYDVHYNKTFINRSVSFGHQKNYDPFNGGIDQNFPGPWIDFIIIGFGRYFLSWRSSSYCSS